MSDWISVEDRLPEAREGVDGEYLVATDNEDFRLIIVSYNSNQEMFDCEIVGDFCVTHWMPLPAPPKEDGVDEAQAEYLQSQEVEYHAPPKENNSASWTECENCGLIHDPKLTRCSLDILKESK